MANPNFKPEWPLYSDVAGVFVSALPIRTITYVNDGSAIAKFDGAYAEQHLSAQFVSVFRPHTGGYIFRSQFGETLYMSKADFETKYTKSAGVSVKWADVTDKPATFAPVAATASVVGGVKMGSAVADSSATEVDGVNTALNALLASLRAAGVIASN